MIDKKQSSGCLCIASSNWLDQMKLAGGQRQGVSLARAAYVQESGVVLDDHFPAFDSGTGKQIFERFIATPLFNVLAFLGHPRVTSYQPSSCRQNPVDCAWHGKNRFYGAWDDFDSLFTIR
jgi:ABC-type uncharacterized transport system fused permease/ATPase subunit